MFSFQGYFVFDKQWPSTLMQPPKGIPENLVRSLIAAKKVNQRILTLEKLAFSKFVLLIHCLSLYHII